MGRVPASLGFCVPERPGVRVPYRQEVGIDVSLPALRDGRDSGCPGPLALACRGSPATGGMRGSTGVRRIGPMDPSPGVGHADTRWGWAGMSRTCGRAWLMDQRGSAMGLYYAD